MSENNNALIKDKKHLLIFLLSVVAFIAMNALGVGQWSWVMLPSLCTSFVMMLGWM